MEYVSLNESVRLITSRILLSFNVPHSFSRDPWNGSIDKLFKASYINVSARTEYISYIIFVFSFIDNLTTLQFSCIYRAFPISSWMEHTRLWMLFHSPHTSTSKFCFDYVMGLMLVTLSLTFVSASTSTRLLLRTITSISKQLHVVISLAPKSWKISSHDLH